MKHDIVDMVNNYSFTTATRIVDMWKMGNILPEGIDPTQRVAQVIAALQDGNGYIVGVNTAYPMSFEYGTLAGKEVYAMRQFILPASRDFALNKKLLWSSFDILNDSHNNATGIVLILENLKLTRKGYTKRYKDIGFVKVAAPNIHNEVWYKPFGTKMGEPLPDDFMF